MDSCWSPYAHYRRLTFLASSSQAPALSAVQSVWRHRPGPSRGIPLAGRCPSTYRSPNSWRSFSARPPSCGRPALDRCLLQALEPSRAEIGAAEPVKHTLGRGQTLCHFSLIGACNAYLQPTLQFSPSNPTLFLLCLPKPRFAYSAEYVECYRHKPQTADNLKCKLNLRGRVVITNTSRLPAEAHCTCYWQDKDGWESQVCSNTVFPNGGCSVFKSLSAQARSTSSPLFPCRRDIHCWC